MDNGNEGAQENERNWHSKWLRDEMGVDDEVEHSLNDMASIDDVPNPAPSAIPQKHGLPPLGEIISHCHTKHQKKRAEKVIMQGHENRHAHSLHNLAAKSTLVLNKIKLASLPAAYDSYAVKLQPKDGDEKHKFHIDELKNGYGFQYIAWDSLTPKPITDEEEMIFAVLAGQLHNSSYIAEA
ncbi:hypothetical protein ARMGADRAFT_1091394 [Armillaria gallica]|uniref:Uncharacterized protein n=1 Tax=Armillaria gallica TaxID=47427 RepID=A0A2H3CSF6_ARMGA|nr:hypothetical protein ARMGADRAFT_1091394 [Armillaria gallica]